MNCNGEENCDKVCERCKLSFIPDGQGGFADPCIGLLPGVSFACCGHGVSDGYIKFNNGVIVRFPKLEVDGIHRNSVSVNPDGIFEILEDGNLYEITPTGNILIGPASELIKE